MGGKSLRERNRGSIARGGGGEKRREHPANALQSLSYKTVRSSGPNDPDFIRAIGGAG
jgi:hypothetical protein